MRARLAFVCCLTGFQTQLVASYRVNVKKLVDEKVEQARAKSAEEVEQAEAVSTLAREKVERDGAWPRYYKHWGAGTLVSENKQFFRTSQWRKLGQTVQAVKFALEEACTSTLGCVGFHIHEGEGHSSYLTGALLLNKQSAWPLPKPATSGFTDAEEGWQGNGGSEEMTLQTETSTKCGMGWEGGWQAYTWDFSSGDCEVLQNEWPRSCTAWNSCTHVKKLGNVHNCQDWCADHGLACQSSWLLLDEHASHADCSTPETDDVNLIGAFFPMPFCWVGSDHNNFQKCACTPWLGN